MLLALMMQRIIYQFLESLKGFALCQTHHHSVMLTLTERPEYHLENTLALRGVHVLLRNQHVVRPRFIGTDAGDKGFGKDVVIFSTLAQVFKLGRMGFNKGVKRVGIVPAYQDKVPLQYLPDDVH